MIPDNNDPFWDKVLVQKPQAQSLGLRLILDNLSRGLDKKSITKETAKSEILAFFKKYEKLGEKELEFLRAQIQ